MPTTVVKIPSLVQAMRQLIHIYSVGATFSSVFIFDLQIRVVLALNSL